MLGWSALQATYPVLQMPDELKAVTPQRGPAEKVQQKEKFQQKANLYNPIIALGMVGAAIGVSLAVGRGLIARSMPRVVVSAFLGLVAGAGFGCLGGWVGHLVVSQMPKVNVPLSSQIMLHVAVMATMATGIGWAIGIPGGTLRSALGGLLAGAAAGVLAGMAYPILAAVFVPTASTGIHCPRPHPGTSPVASTRRRSPGGNAVRREAEGACSREHVAAHLQGAGPGTGAVGAGPAFGAIGNAAGAARNRLRFSNSLCSCFPARVPNWKVRSNSIEKLYSIVRAFSRTDAAATVISHRRMPLGARGAGRAGSGPGGPSFRPA